MDRHGIKTVQTGPATIPEGERRRYLGRDQCRFWGRGVWVSSSDLVPDLYPSLNTRSARGNFTLERKDGPRLTLVLPSDTVPVSVRPTSGPVRGLRNLSYCSGEWCILAEGTRSNIYTAVQEYCWTPLQ